MFSKTKGIIALFLVSYSIQAMELEKRQLFVPSRLGEVSVHHNGNDFSIRSSSGVRTVERHNLDKELRGMNREQLATVLALGSYVAVNKAQSGDEYSLKLQHRLKGGGPVLANAVYWLTKSTCYGTAAAAIGAGVAVAAPAIATGAGAAAAAATGSAAVGTAVTTATGGVLTAGINAGSSTTIGAALTSGSASAIAGGLGMSAAATSAATTATGIAVASTGGCLATLAGAVEVVSLSAAAFALSLPTP